MLEIPPPKPAWLPVSEAARILGVSPRRVRQLVAEGKLLSKPIDGVMHLKRDALFARKNGGPLGQRPLSERSLRLLKDQLAAEMGEPRSVLWESATRDERRRARERSKRLRNDADPAHLMRAWMANAQPPMRLWGDAEVLEKLRQYASGFSHPSAHLASSGQLEIQVSHVPLGLQGHPDSHHDVPVLVHLEPEVPSVRHIDVAFDLVSHGKTREDDAARRLIAI